MASIGKYRKKIKSAKNIAKITKAMQLVAASKMKKAQIMALSGKEYSEGITDLASILSTHLDKTIHPLINANLNSQKPTLIILISPEKGLCGGLVTNISRSVNKAIIDENRNVKFITVGNKAKQIVKRLGLSSIAEFSLGLSYPSFELVPPIARLVEEKFITEEYKSVKILYAEFINTMYQEVTAEALLPLQLNIPLKSDEPKINKEYLFEPSPSDIVNPLLKMYLETKIYHILLEAYASEQSARMVAMKNATDNAKSLIEQLTIEYNKVRQSMITNEILDIGNQAFVNA